MGPLSGDHILYLNEDTSTALPGGTFYPDGNGPYLIGQVYWLHVAVECWKYS